ncbi:MAG TPA: hypothetical protein VFS00_10510 [Polyangiaceae bacterium]|nr:hypothetical protein [Polyangiaceae bacterium]
MSGGGVMQGSVDLSSNLDAYVALVVALADPGAEREARLRSAGLDEPSWEAIDAAWQARLSEAMGAEQDDVPPLVLAYAQAFTLAQSARGGPPLSFERFVEATRAVRGAADVMQELRKLGLTFEQFLVAQRYWLGAMTTDAGLSARFVAALA